MIEYASLFVASFLAATILPFASEIPLAILVRRTGDLLGPVLVATVGNYLGACTTYLLARGAVRRFAPRAEASSPRAIAALRRYGSPALLMSWVPVIGDAVVVVAGAAKIPFAAFSLWTVIGKAARYAMVAWLARP
jgi:membrane protein YqaA with SNARE-associated domain